VKDVARKLGVSESTVSRLINSKYVKTPQGTYRPLSDDEIADILRREGYRVARRTVAKYRELLGIPPPSVFYLSGFSSTHAYVVLTPSSRYLLTDSRYYLRAREELPDWEVVEIKGASARFIKKFLRGIGVRKVGYESDRVSCEFRKKLRTRGIRWVPCPGFLKDLRAVKTREEIEIMREGVRKSDTVYLQLLQLIGPGMTELEVRSRVVEGIFRVGGRGESFPTIVAGKNALSGQTRSGVCEDLHGCKFFTHSTGHGVGVEIHEYPRIYHRGESAVKVVEEGMVFTLEPGVYLPGRFGVRLENMIAVVGGRGEPLSEVSLDLVSL